MRRRIVAPDFDTAHRGFEEDIAAINTAAMREAGGLFLSDLRQEVADAGLGSRLGRTWRLKTYPTTQTSMSPSAWVFSKAPMLIEVFEKGVTIQARGSRWLAVPTEAAGARVGRSSNGRAKRLTPAIFERRTGIKLRLIYRRGRRVSFLVADNARLNKSGAAARNVGRSRAGGEFTRLAGRTTVIVFLLVPQVRLRKRLNNNAILDRGAGRIPALISKHWR